MRTLGLYALGGVAGTAWGIANAVVAWALTRATLYLHERVADLPGDVNCTPKLASSQFVAELVPFVWFGLATALAFAGGRRIGRRVGQSRAASAPGIALCFTVAATVTALAVGLVAAGLLWSAIASFC